MADYNAHVSLHSIHLRTISESPLKIRSAHLLARQFPVGSPFPVEWLVPQHAPQPPTEHDANSPRQAPAQRNPPRHRKVRATSIKNLYWGSQSGSPGRILKEATERF